jgi:hypothetical protein
MENFSGISKMKKQKGLLRAGHYDFEDYRKNKNSRSSGRRMKKQYVKKERRAWVAEIAAICAGKDAAFPESIRCPFCKSSTCSVSIESVVWEGDFYFTLIED